MYPDLMRGPTGIIIDLITVRLRDGFAMAHAGIAARVTTCSCRRASTSKYWGLAPGGGAHSSVHMLGHQILKQTHIMETYRYHMETIFAVISCIFACPRIDPQVQGISILRLIQRMKQSK
jgi:hypothetical protein